MRKVKGSDINIFFDTSYMHHFLRMLTYLFAIIVFVSLNNFSTTPHISNQLGGRLLTAIVVSGVRMLDGSVGGSTSMFS
jgi:hypothetical protein